MDVLPLAKICHVCGTEAGSVGHPAGEMHVRVAGGWGQLLGVWERPSGPLSSLPAALLLGLCHPLVPPWQAHVVLFLIPHWLLDCLFRWSTGLICVHDICIYRLQIQNCTCTAILSYGFYHVAFVLPAHWLVRSEEWAHEIQHCNKSLDACISVNVYRKPLTGLLRIQTIDGKQVQSWSKYVKL